MTAHLSVAKTTPEEAAEQMVWLLADDAPTAGFGFFRNSERFDCSFQDSGATASKSIGKGLAGRCGARVAFCLLVIAVHTRAGQAQRCCGR